MPDEVALTELLSDEDRRRLAVQLIFHSIIALRFRARMGQLIPGEVEEVTDALDGCAFAHGPDLRTDLNLDILHQVFSTIVERYGTPYEECRRLTDPARRLAPR